MLARERVMRFFEIFLASVVLWTQAAGLGYSFLIFKHIHDTPSLCDIIMV
jgi:hypothetical protein